jgi:hypothetical protein
VKSLLDILHFAFGCRHRQQSGVFTIKKRTYQVCLKCEREFEYSWVRMRSVGSAVASRNRDAPLEEREAH